MDIVIRGSKSKKIVLLVSLIVFLSIITWLIYFSYFTFHNLGSGPVVFSMNPGNEFPYKLRNCSCATPHYEQIFYVRKRKVWATAYSTFGGSTIMIKSNHPRRKGKMFVPGHDQLDIKLTDANNTLITRLNCSFVQGSRKTTLFFRCDGFGNYSDRCVRVQLCERGSDQCPFKKPMWLQRCHYGSNYDPFRNYSSEGTMVSKKKNLAVCSMVGRKTSFDYLFEWIEYHLIIGVDHFYVHFKGPKSDYPDIEKMLQPYVEERIVTLYDWNVVDRNDIWVDNIAQQNDCLHRYADFYHSMMFTDDDEFLTPVKVDSMIPMLREYYQSSPARSGLHIRSHFKCKNYTRNKQNSDGTLELLSNEMFPNSAHGDPFNKKKFREKSWHYRKLILFPDRVKILDTHFLVAGQNCRNLEDCKSELSGPSPARDVAITHVYFLKKRGGTTVEKKKDMPIDRFLGEVKERVQERQKALWNRYHLPPFDPTTIPWESPKQQ